MNIITRHLAKAAGLFEVKPGQDITVQVDLAIAHDVTAPMAIEQFHKIGVSEVFDPKRVVFVIDHIFPAATVNARRSHNMLLNFQKEYNIKVFHQGEGVIHQVIAEEELVKRGEIVIGADSHTCTAGAYGAIAIPVGSTELAATMAIGTIDLEVPAVDLIHLDQRPDKSISAKDMILMLIKIFGTDGFTDRGIIFSGQGFIQLSLAEKMTICNMCIEMGAMIAYMALETEEIGETDNQYYLKADQFEPVVACPHSPGNVKPLRELSGREITQVVIGSCTNGRIEDIRVAAQIVRGEQVDQNVTMIVVPASRRVLHLMEVEGLTKIFRDAGASVLNPGCGPCFGAHMGLASKEDIVVSTTNRNFPGRMGHPEAQIYLASPKVAAEAALVGKIIDHQWEARRA